ncbi:MAG: hypothetical protein AAF353_16565, partial [Pseudomonadota bacterium]
VVLTMKMPARLSSRIVSLKGLDSEQIDRFSQRAARMSAVAEAAVYEIDEVAYLKVTREFQERDLKELLGT